MAKHNVFISFHHANDEDYKDDLVDLLGDSVIPQWINDGDYSEDLSTDYIKRLIREDKISKSTVIIVLIGKCTKARKHVDWEIYAGLSSKAGGRSGIFGMLLPSHKNYQKEKFDRPEIPPRLDDNIDNDYVIIYDWSNYKSTVLNRIEAAFNRKNDDDLEVDNSRVQFKNNRTC